MGKGVNREGRGRRVGEYEEMSWAGTIWRERKKEAGYEDGLILSCGLSYTEMEFLNGFVSRGYWE